MAADSGPKTILDLSLELGLRSQRIMEALEALGLNAESVDSPVEADIEPVLVEHLVDEGALPESMMQGKGRRKKSSQSAVDDDMVKHALGASESGYNESNIPRRVMLESSFEESGGFFSRLFGKKNSFAQSLKEHEYNTEEIDSLFSDSIQTSPRQPQAQETPQEQPAEASQAQEEESLEDDFDMEGLDEFEGDELNEMQPAGEEDEDSDAIDQDLLNELDDIDVDDESLGDEELDTAQLDALEGDEGLTEGDVSGLDDSLGLQEDELEFDAEGEQLDDLQLEGSETEDQEGEEERPPGWLEKIINRINLSPAETWTLMIGSVTTMLLLLGITMYWWLFISPRAQQSLLEQAIEHKQAAQEAETWSAKAPEWQNAAEDFDAFIQQYPQNPNEKLAFSELCNAYYQLARGHESAANNQPSEEAYRQTAQLYQNYLDYIENQANEAAEQFANNEEARRAEDAPRAVLFPDPAEQMLALRRIAEAYQKLQQYENAVDTLQRFVDRYGQTDQGLEAYQQLAETYIKWSSTNKEQETELLEQATNTFDEAINIIQQKPNPQHLALAKKYAGLGDIKFQLYKLNEENEKPQEARLHLDEAIANYELAEEHARQAEGLELIEKQRILKQLADMYLILGRQAGAKWSDFEERASNFPDGIQYKQQLLNAVSNNKQLTQQYLGQANERYDELLTHSLPEEMKEEILYHKTDSLFILRNYQEALAAGESLINAQGQEENQGEEGEEENIKTKLLYLLGHVGWEMAREQQNPDYTVAKKYYRQALEENPFYPKAKNGETSHLAEIRLTNIYFLLENDYEQAIKRFQDAAERYPDTGYTYLTLYWYGQALMDYGKQLEENPNMQNEAEGITPENQYEQAVQTYNRAIESREPSTHVDIHNERYLIEIMFKRALAAFKANSYRQSLDYYKQALQEYDNNRLAQQYIPQAIETMGDIYSTLGDYDNAIAQYQNYLTNQYADPDGAVQMKLGDAFLNQLSEEKARERYRRIIRDFGLNNRNSPGFRALKQIAHSYDQEAGLLSGEERLNKKQQALDAYSELAQNFPLPDSSHLPNDPPSLRKIGNIHFELSNHQKAIDAYQAYLKNATSLNRPGIVQYRIAKSQMALNQPSEAIDTLNNISENNMDNTEQFISALMLLAQAYEGQADQYMENNQPELWENSLQQAKLVYNRVNAAAANLPDDAKQKTITEQANLGRQSIDTLIQSRREVAQTQ